MKIGFIGLGIMGKPMSKNLLKAGYDLIVMNRSPTPVEELVAAGAKAAETPKAVAEQSDIVITMLPNSPHVKAVVLGENGIIEGVIRHTLSDSHMLRNSPTSAIRILEISISHLRFVSPLLSPIHHVGAENLISQTTTLLYLIVRTCRYYYSIFKRASSRLGGKWLINLVDSSSYLLPAHTAYQGTPSH